MIGDGRNWRAVVFMALEVLLSADLRFSFLVDFTVLASDAVMWTGGREHQIRAGCIMYGMAIPKYK